MCVADLALLALRPMRDLLLTGMTQDLGILFPQIIQTQYLFRALLISVDMMSLNCSQISKILSQAAMTSWRYIWGCLEPHDLSKIADNFAGKSGLNYVVCFNLG